jgi:transcriptional regulator with XRE-family HTH domain
MDAASPWPALIKRLRFLSSLKQAELALQLGVDQATVSRWERDVYVPDICVQKRLRDMLLKLEPIVDRAFVEQAPALMAVTHIGNAGHIECMSRLVSDTYQRTPDEMRGVEVYDFTTESILKVLLGLNANEAWCKGEVASWKVVMQQCDRSWAKYSGAPMGQSGLCMWIGGTAWPPKAALKDGFQLTVIPFDELVG